MAVYLDGVLVYAKSGEDRMQLLKTGLKRAGEHRLFLQLAECEMMKQTPNCLGFVSGLQRVAAGPRKVNTIQQWPGELWRQQMAKGFLRPAGQCPKPIPSPNKLAHPLSQLLKLNSDRV